MELFLFSRQRIIKARMPCPKITFSLSSVALGRGVRGGEGKGESEGEREGAGRSGFILRLKVTL